MKISFIILILTAAIICVIALNQFNILDQSSNSTRTYSAYGVSFNYPQQWVINKPIAENEIISVGSNGGKVLLNVYKFNSTKNSTENITANYKLGLNSDIYAKNKTEKNRTVNGLNATEITYVSMDDESTFKESVLFFEKNGSSYVIQYLAFPPELYDRNKERFDMIIESFKIE